jgi:acetylornithine deacetylase/succinyl-diaminopimelate desuccinylase-like protein
MVIPYIQMPRSTLAGTMLLEEEAVQLTQQLIALNTVNPALEPGAPGERAAVELLAARLEQRNFTIEIVGPAERPSLLATHRGSGDGPALALNGHLDTVPAGGMVDPFTPRIDGDRLYGRGSCDMKAGIAAMVVAAEAAASAGTAGDVLLALVADEEHGSLGTTAVIAELTRGKHRLPAACIVAEPTWLDLASAHRGYAVVEVELRGRAAHSSRPQDGVNAVTHLGRLLAAVEARDAELAARPPHPEVGSGSLQATVASGGTAPFVIPDRARATIERRTVPGEPRDAGLDEVEAILAADPDFQATCEQTLARDAWELASDTPVIRRLIALLGAPERVGFPYWMESALWEQAGVPAVVCGPAGGGLHTDVEWVELTQLRTYTRTLAGLIVAFSA